MKKILINNKEYSLPENYSEITLRHQIAVSNASIDDTKVNVLALLSGYGDIPMKELKHIKTQEVVDAFKHLEWIKNTPLPTEAITNFEFKGVKYNVLSSLIKNEFQDFISTESTIENNKNSTWNALPMLAAILSRVGNESLDDYDIEQRAKEFEELPIEIANRIANFFLSIGNLSSLPTLLYSNRKLIVEEKVKEVENILNNQVGQGLLTRLLRGILRIYLKFIKRNLNKYFTS